MTMSMMESKNVEIEVSKGKSINTYLQRQSAASFSAAE